jgi:hypothetical protein
VRFHLNDTSVNLYMIGASYSFQVPGGDMAKTFGPNSTISANVSYKTYSNWIFSAEYSYLFSKNVKIDPLDSISTHDPNYRFVINSNGQYASITNYERGGLAFIKVAKLIPLDRHNLNSGIIIRAGGGFMYHKIFYYFVGTPPPQLAGDYIKGYDRLTDGPAFDFSVG